MDAIIGTTRVEHAWNVLAEVPDPEVPAISVCDLGVVRNVIDAGEMLEVVLTPTYSGCPALRVIEEDIIEALTASGLAPVRVETVYAPAWTTDWLSAAAKQKLEQYGIAPPGPAVRQSLVRLTRAAVAEHPCCPYCGSHDTTVRSEFGSTACKAICYCKGCEQPFELFKAI